MDCSLPGSSVHVILQTRILEWVAMPSSSIWEYITQNARLDDSQAGIKIAGRNINKWYADDTTLMAESRGTKESLDEVEREEWKRWLKTQHSKN